MGAAAVLVGASQAGGELLGPAAGVRERVARLEERVDHQSKTLERIELKVDAILRRERHE